ncbi:MAG: class B sortase [Oscillospiraceae bacterium]|nr:class B sortase [Oscillospiraceae bacterium]
MKRHRRFSPLWLCIVILLIGVFAFSGSQIWRHVSEEREVAEQFDRLTSQIERPPSPPQGQPNYTDDAPAEWTVFDQYGALFSQNPDMIGWISIDGTSINYPVMHTPGRPDFYLRRNFRGERCRFGTPYIFEYATLEPQSDNITIFAHNMGNSRMFGSLMNYRNATFLAEHPIINFDTIAGFGRYEIITVFIANPTAFPYHMFVNAAVEDEFDEFVRRGKELAVNSTGVTATYGDRLITLSTCINTRPDYRLVVVARKI